MKNIMPGQEPTICYRYTNGRLAAVEQKPVAEFPLVLHVNGRELATLIASPHELRFLVAGFLRLQGFISTLGDVQALSVCEDAGIANVVLRNEVPEQLRPVLTSGCGTGITFSLPKAVRRQDKAAAKPRQKFSAASIFALMADLSKLAERYRQHGGIHSAAIGDGRQLILFAEDLGRHNTIDRLAGEALLRGIDLKGRLLATSGRVSSEMAAKAAMLGITLIASRTSPTDMAVRLCRESGIMLIGYVRGGGLTIYGPPEALEHDTEGE